MGMLTKNFSRKEMACKCKEDCGAEMSGQFMFRLQKLRFMAGVPFKINSGARCPKHNAAVGGVPTSKHLADGEDIKAKAADIHCTSSVLRQKIVSNAKMCGLYGIGIDKNFVHVDMRDEEDAALWLY